jgi:hypothetical protein
MGLHQTNFLIAKETVTGLKRHLPEWKEVSANYTSDKGLITRIYRELKN